MNTPLQEAVSKILVEAQRSYQGFENYYLWLNDMYQHKKELMLRAIEGSGMKAIKPKGAYYIMVDASKYIDLLRKKGKFRPLVLSDPTTFYDWQFVQWMIEVVGIAVVPGSAFCDYSRFDQDSEFKYIRFAYCMSDDTIRETAKKLQSIPKLLNDGKHRKLSDANAPVDEEEDEKKDGDITLGSNASSDASPVEEAQHVITLGSDLPDGANPIASETDVDDGNALMKDSKKLEKEIKHFE